LLVLELGQRGVDGAGADPPGAAGSIAELAHDLVAMHRLLGQQREDGGADVPATGTAAGEEGRLAAAEAKLVPMPAAVSGASQHPLAEVAAPDTDGMDDVIGHVWILSLCIHTEGVSRYIAIGKSPARSVHWISWSRLRMIARR